ncbi:MAG: hypothetical protein HUU49_05120 [Candidatus Buchananbacteria bacterium]|nr:hypothetical protein [Candidatus Buchananbacteria bacterium]
MDYWSRIFISIILGVAAGISIGHFFGDTVFWVFIAVAVSLATETSLRTIKNVKGPINPVLEKTSRGQLSGQNIELPKAKKPKF